ncbi:hypothetical protein AGDE_09646 [Angomonas deanei]|nr:hypothetical protein AGDE_09646 [Angomonas deanei]|eukprot:EPY30033.1 hypothetical protein AGDE_09646 [Angomonas deanei]
MSEAETAEGSTTGALGLVLLLPLYAGDSRRQKVLEGLQSAVLGAAQGGRKGASSTPCEVVVRCAMKQDGISLTTLNTIVESMAREESRFTISSSASELICKVLSEKNPAGGYTVPAEVAVTAIQHFFPLPSEGWVIKKDQATIHTGALLPRVQDILSSKTPVPASSIEFVRAVASRSVIQPAGKPEQDPTVQLCVALLLHSHLTTAASSVTVPVFHHALTILSHTLQEGDLMSEIQNSGTSLVYSSKKRGSTTKKAGGLSEEYIAGIAQFIAPTVIRAVQKIGAEVCTFCVGTNGGYYRITLPFIFTADTLSSQADVVIDVLQELAPSSGTALWQPPTSCVVSSPLRYEDAIRLLQCSSGGARVWSPSVQSVNRLRLLSAVLSASPAIRYDDDEDEQSLYHLVMTVLTDYPLDKMATLFTLDGHTEQLEKEIEAAEMLRGSSQLSVLQGGHRVLSALARHVLTLVQNIVGLYCESGPVLNEKTPDGAANLRATLLKQSLVLMATLLLQDEEERKLVNEEEEGAVHAENVGMREKIDAISEMLRVLAPLLSSAREMKHARSAKKGEDGELEEDVLRQTDFYLHIPIVALLVRLEPLELTDALHFKTAAEVCRDILNSFDIRTQIQCISQLMRLVCDPATQLSSEESGDEELVKLFRRLVKPNQIINRQENVLNLINSTVKSDSFLGPFIELQHRTSRSDRAKGQKKKKSEDKEEEDETEDVVADGSRTDSVCMSLIINALEFFSHYCDLNQNTPNDAEVGDVDGFGENKSYTMLLELLSGNALACVLAGINEPTFVFCLERLLADKRAGVQLKGLEVLVDRLHHSLPTVENTMTDEELEQHLRDLRDPKKKLTLMDLVRVKARPLTTKRSFALYGILEKLQEICLLGAVQDWSASSLPHKARTQLLFMSQLCVAAMEELVRIVGSGGSTQAEKTLLNVNRSRRVTEATLTKLFGNKARVQEVYQSALTLCEKRIPKITQSTHKLLHGTAEDMDSEVRRELEDHLLAVLATSYTFLGTVTQVMGSSFVLQHCTAILNTIVSGAVYELTELPPLVAQGEAGSLVRHATLSSFIRCFPSCWHMSHPYLPQILFSATHLTNINDTETFYLCQEVLTVLEALLEPQVFVDACTECFRGVTYESFSKSRTIKIKAATHSFDHFFACVGRRLQNLKKEELLHMPVVTEGTTPQDNFWLAVLQTLAASPTVPPSELVTPVLQAYLVFFLKFKPKHCTTLLGHIAQWAFGGNSESFTKKLDAEEKDEEEDEEHQTESTPKVVLHRWILFFSLFNFLLDKLEVILEFAFAVATVYIVPVLANHCSSSKSTSKVNASLIALVLEGALDSIRRMALAHTPGPDADPSIPVNVYFATTEVFNSIMPPLVRQLTNTTYLADGGQDYLHRAAAAAIPAVKAFFACLNSNKLQSKTQAEIGRGLRHPSPQVRQITIQCLDAIYAEGGEELAARLMAEVLPAVVELTEDRDENVVEETRKFCTNLSHMTGQDVLRRDELNESNKV